MFRRDWGSHRTGKWSCNIKEGMGHFLILHPPLQLPLLTLRILVVLVTSTHSSRSLGMQVPPSTLVYSLLCTFSYISDFSGSNLGIFNLIFSSSYSLSSRYIYSSFYGWQSWKIGNWLALQEGDQKCIGWNIQIMSFLGDCTNYRVIESHFAE